MTSFAGHPQAILTEIYIEALIVDEALADRVWEAWDAGLISDDVANFVSELDKAFENVTIVREQDEEGAASKKH